MELWSVAPSETKPDLVVMVGISQRERCFIGSECTLEKCLSS